MSKRKKKHGGLKFLAFLFVVGLLVTTIVVGGKSEIGQRIMGNREDHRLERTSLTPRYGYASATLQVTESSMYNADGTAVDLTTTRDVSLDRKSSMSSTDISIARTPTQMAPGVSAIPFDDFKTSYTEIMTKDAWYESPAEGGHSWTRHPFDANYAINYYGSTIDTHYIPMIDDIIGFQLRDLPSKPIGTEPKSGFTRLTRPAVDGPAATSASTKTFSYELDLKTFNRAAPILARRTGFLGPAETAVTLTIGFDDVGLLRFADVAIPGLVAAGVAQELGTGERAYYHFVFKVTEISGEPSPIDIPTDVVDEAPQDSPPAP
jgi:hypothetical protein